MYNQTCPKDQTHLERQHAVPAQDGLEGAARVERTRVHVSDGKSVPVLPFPNHQCAAAHPLELVLPTPA